MCDGMDRGDLLQAGAPVQAVELHDEDELVDLDKRITVRYQGRTLFNGKLRRTRDNMRQSLSERGDLSYIFPARVTVKTREK